ncbi:hypothetical protein ACJX0J_020029, partial [Zea mays]
ASQDKLAISPGQKDGKKTLDQEKPRSFKEKKAVWKIANHLTLEVKCSKAVMSQEGTAFTASGARKHDAHIFDPLVEATVESLTIYKGFLLK